MKQREFGNCLLVTQEVVLGFEQYSEMRRDGIKGSFSRKITWPKFRTEGGKRVGKRVGRMAEYFYDIKDST